MATLHLMVGLPCSGKTVLAKQLEQEHSALRLTPDEWHLQLFGQDIDKGDHDLKHDLVESLLWEVASRVLELGVDVILDFGFWTREQRDDFRERAQQLEVNVKIHYTDATPDELLSRLAQRNALLPDGAFYISESKLKEWLPLFEPPEKEEMES